jgi:hypothetical protein
LVGHESQDRAGRPRHSRLEQNIYRGKDSRRQELLRRDGLAVDEGERSLPPPIASAIDFAACTVRLMLDREILRNALT